MPTMVWLAIGAGLAAGVLAALMVWFILCLMATSSWSGAQSERMLAKDENEDG